MIEGHPSLLMRIARARTRTVIAIVVCLSAAFAGLIIFSSSSSHSTTIGTPASSVIAAGQIAPAFTEPAVDASAPPVSSSSWRGHPVVLNFFASWCHPCKQELPLLSRTAAKFSSKARFVGVDVNDSDANARRLLAASDVHYTVAADPQDAVTLRYGVVGLPTTVFIGANGRVLDVHSGPLTAKILDTWLGHLD
jgi:thiol-disulfide isomerase/thioredoxin